MKMRCVRVVVWVLLLMLAGLSLLHRQATVGAIRLHDQRRPATTKEKKKMMPWWWNQDYSRGGLTPGGALCRLGSRPRAESQAFWDGTMKASSRALGGGATPLCLCLHVGILGRVMSKPSPGLTGRRPCRCKDVARRVISCALVSIRSSRALSS
ncbi:hypothetical protein MUK42_05824 [Musa troglodytarum]|uniref:Secreted protein n=1 Tax=Musa troglodytarum TaxID=320322 RepID=A0A9E7K6M0_9LILI|nr:hypothetical protein MUK42_05824 [Musa troglodytarum]